MARRGVRRLPGLALQREALQYGAPPEAEPRVARLARGHGAKAGRSLGAHPLVTPEEALEKAREAGIHRLRIPTPFAVGRVNCYLIEDEPLTLVDTGRNSRGRGDRAALGVAELSSLGRACEGDAPPPRRRGAAARSSHPRGPAPPRPQPLRHPFLGRGAADSDRCRPPAGPHLLEPADIPATRWFHGAPSRPHELHRFASPHPRVARGDRPAGPWRADHGPSNPDRRALRAACSQGREDPRTDRGASSQRL